MLEQLAHGDLRVEPSDALRRLESAKLIELHLLSQPRGVAWSPRHVRDEWRANITELGRTILSRRSAA